jgi:3-deoxy-7-phosphoheptulonate synthase
MEFIRKLPIPKEIREQYPLSDAQRENKRIFDGEVAKIFTGESNKKLLIIGPCSADNEDSVMDYVTRLAKVGEKVKDKLVIIPRIYTNKPRTTGDGYKGMLHQPDPQKSTDMLAGIIAIRHLHLRVIEETGMFTADEMLYPENYQYLFDLLSYVAIGARSVENQQHRLVASGIEIPVGMKNPTGGDISVMMNSVMAAQHSHTFLYRGWEVKSSGNPLAHTILRGYVNKHGESLPNYHYEDIEHLCAEYAKRELVNPALVVDCNHANSGKKYKEQMRIAKEVLHSCDLNPDINQIFKGFMVESYIEEGSQKIGEGIYGKSITDPCIGWKDTEEFIYYMADKV